MDLWQYIRGVLALSHGLWLRRALWCLGILSLAASSVRLVRAWSNAGFQMEHMQSLFPHNIVQEEDARYDDDQWQRIDDSLNKLLDTAIEYNNQLSEELERAQRRVLVAKDELHSLQDELRELD